MRLNDKWNRFKATSRKKKIITAIVVLAVVLLLGVRILGALGKAAPVEVKQTYIPVNVQTVQKQNISTNITLSGKVQADKEAAVIVKSMGRVQSISVKVGDIVKKDQILFSLDKSEMQATYDQTLAGYMLAQAGYDMNRDKYEKALEDYENAKQLHAIGAISNSELDVYKMQASDAVLRTAEAQLAQAKAQYDSVSKTYSDLDVKAPIDGILTALNVKVGDLATSSAPVAAVVDMQKVSVNVSVSEKVINHIKNGQEVLVEISSAGKTVKGKVESLSLAASQTGKYELKVYVDNTDGLIKPGMFAKVAVDTSTRENVIVVPSEAVIFHNGLNVAYVVDGNKVKEREVTAGLDNGKQTEIVEGLAEGEVIVIKGMNFVKDDSEIKIIEKDGDPANQDVPQAGGGAKQ